MAGEFQRMLDNAIIVSRNIFILTVFVILFPIVAVFLHTRSIVLNAVHRNVVTVMELNPLLRDNPRIPYLPPKDKWKLDKWEYFRGSSVREAEDWLLAHGYKCRKVATETSPRGEDISYKTFAVQGDPGTPQESIVMMFVNYGDGELYEIPFRYAEGKSPVNWSRFQRIEVPEKLARADVGGAEAYFELSYYSTDQEFDWFWAISGFQYWPSGSHR